MQGRKNHRLHHHSPRAAQRLQKIERPAPEGKLFCQRGHKADAQRSPPEGRALGQSGAALYGAGRLDLLSHPFIAFHVSGGTTEAVLVRPDKERIFTAEIVSCSLDLKGGQAVDRVGVMLGLSFPAGKELEQLALQWKQPCKVKASVKGQDFSLSGIENQCKKLLETGHPKEEIARFCLDSILAALDYAAKTLLQTFGNLPLLFAGGVMSNSIIRQALTEKYGACFAPPEYSADNAAGIAVLTAMKEGQL